MDIVAPNYYEAWKRSQRHREFFNGLWLRFVASAKVTIAHLVRDG
jgi:hypothetical protein